MQFVGDEVEVVVAEDSECVAATEVQDEIRDGISACLSSHDLGDYDYISVGRDGFVPVSIKPTNLTRLSNLGLQ
jgi:hypothetical protein